MFDFGGTEERQPKKRPLTGYPENMGHEPLLGFDPETNKPITTEALKNFSDQQTSGRNALWEEARQRWMDAQEKKFEPPEKESGFFRFLSQAVREVENLSEKIPLPRLPFQTEVPDDRFFNSIRRRNAQRIPKDHLRSHYSPEMSERLGGLDRESERFLATEAANAGDNEIRRNYREVMAEDLQEIRQREEDFRSLPPGEQQRIIDREDFEKRLKRYKAPKQIRSGGGFAPLGDTFIP